MNATSTPICFKFLWRLSLKTQLEDWVLCANYRTSKLLEKIPESIVYWIHFQNIHTFKYKKTLLYKLLMLNFKITESLQCILKVFNTMISRGWMWGLFLLLISPHGDLICKSPSLYHSTYEKTWTRKNSAFGPFSRNILTP